MFPTLDSQKTEMEEALGQMRAENTNLKIRLDSIKPEKENCDLGQKVETIAKVGCGASGDDWKLTGPLALQVVGKSAVVGLSAVEQRVRDIEGLVVGWGGREL